MSGPAYKKFKDAKKETTKAQKSPVGDMGGLIGDTIKLQVDTLGKVSTEESELSKLLKANSQSNYIAVSKKSTTEVVKLKQIADKWNLRLPIGEAVVEKMVLKLKWAEKKFDESGRDIFMMSYISGISTDQTKYHGFDVDISYPESQMRRTSNLVKKLKMPTAGISDLADDLRENLKRLNAERHQMMKNTHSLMTRSKNFHVIRVRNHLVKDSLAVGYKIHPQELKAKTEKVMSMDLHVLVDASDQEGWKGLMTIIN